MTAAFNVTGRATARARLNRSEAGECADLLRAVIRLRRMPGRLSFTPERQPASTTREADVMTGWDNSNRKHELPRDWHRRRAIVLRRDKTCRCNGCDIHARLCLEPSTDVDHITDRDRHDVDGLQGLCHPCHERKTIRDRETKRAERIASRLRPAERHPGLIR